MKTCFAKHLKLLFLFSILTVTFNCGDDSTKKASDETTKGSGIGSDRLPKDWDGKSDWSASEWSVKP